MVRSVTCDPWGNCWFPTWNGVFVHTADGNWVDFTTQDTGIAHPYCHHAAVSDNGLVWIGHHFAQVSLLDNKGTLTEKGDDQWLVFIEADGLGTNFWVETVEIAPDGTIWFGVDGGLSILDHGGTPFDKSDDVWTNYALGASVLTSSVDAILFDRDGCAWLGGYGMLFRKCGEVWTEITFPGVSGCFMCCLDWPGWVHNMDLDHDGHVWIADKCGAAEWDGSGWTLCDGYDAACPLPSNTGQDNGAQDAAVDPNNTIWFGARGTVEAFRLAPESGAPVIPVGIHLLKESIRLIHGKIDKTDGTARLYPSGLYGITVGESLAYSRNLDLEEIKKASQEVILRISELASD